MDVNGKVSHSKGREGEKEVRGRGKGGGAP